MSRVTVRYARFLLSVLASIAFAEAGLTQN
jgi:hypothetical protein